MAVDLDAWLWAHADDWIGGSPGEVTVLRLGAAVEDEVPPDFLHYVAPSLITCVDDRVRRWSLQAAAISLQTEAQQRRACLALTSGFEKRGVPHVFIKGSDLRYRLYPDAARRVCHDVDVLIPRESAPEAVRVLQSLGCGLAVGPSRFLAGLDHSLEATMGGVSVDLHYSVAQARRSRFESRSIVERREGIEVDGGILPVASREDALAVCLIHIGRHEGGAQYIGFRHGLDVLLACERWKDLDWEGLGERVRSWRCLRLAGAGLWTWIPRLGSRIPDAALRSLDPGRVQRLLALRTHRVLGKRGVRARGISRLGQLGRKFFFAEGWLERWWLVGEMWRRMRARLP